MAEHKHTNSLMNEKSPYLQQHAYNPVDWYPWGDAAFEIAKNEDKPIFLSIGYSTCHWCHVMERESFENEAVAAVLNREFVCVKVDREERPDIDHIYMRVCQAMTGNGGWPLTIIMTPEKKPFYAATYLPPHSRQGMPGLTELTEKVGELWRERREELESSGERIAQWLREPATQGQEELREAVLHQAFRQYLKQFDSMYGGFGSAPKFPTPHNLLFLMRYAHLYHEPKAMEMVEKTLESMARGGMYDHIGFGFSRYSTDRFWLAPHFEKMLYDNALLAIAYLEAFQITGRTLYSEMASEIFTYVLRDMTAPEGGFYSAEDADSEGEEGLFYLWEPDEVRKVLGDEADAFMEAYKITVKGNFEGKSIPNLIGNDQLDTARERFTSCRDKLFAARERRVHPFKDDKILTGWNGLMIAALAIGARVLDEPGYYEAADRAAGFVLNHLRRASDGRLLARRRDNQAMYEAYAADYAYMIWGLIELYETGLKTEHLESALQLNCEWIQLFWDDENGGLFLYGTDGETLLSRPKESYDEALPSENSVAAMNWIRLARILGDPDLEQLADRQFAVFASSIHDYPAGHAFWLAAAAMHFQKSTEIVLVGDASQHETIEILRQIQHAYRPNSVWVYRDSQDGCDAAKLIPYLDDMKTAEDRLTLYFCENHTCRSPVSDIAEMRNMLQT